MRRLRLKIRHHGPGPHGSGSPQSEHSGSSSGGGDETEWRGPESTGAEFLQAAYAGRITSSGKLGKGGVNDARIIALEGDGLAVWKEITQGNRNAKRGEEAGDMEVAAYELSKVLGFRHIEVPESVLVTHEGAVGSASRFINDSVNGGHDNVRKVTPEEWTEIMVLDTIMGNRDRPINAGNLIFGSGGRGKCYAIDHGYSHPKGNAPEAVPSYMRATVMALTKERVAAALPSLSSRMVGHIWSSISGAQKAIKSGEILEMTPREMGAWAFIGT